MKRIALAGSVIIGAAFLIGTGCSSDSNNGGGTGGTGGSSTGGSSGRGGSGGSGGSTGGSAGTGGTSGTGGSTGGAGGSAGSGGSGGSAGSGGSGGSAGSGGSTGGSSADMRMGDGSGAETGGGGSASAMMSFFITSETTMTPNLGGIAMADAKCQRLAMAAGVGSKTWKAYLSTSMENARARIGNGPWFNFKGEMVAANLMQLHEEGGMKNNLTQQTSLTDKGLIVSGRTTKLPGEANEHDILTGSLINGMVAGANTCSDWTSTQGMKQVGHSDRMGVQDDPIVAGSWNAAHTSTCANTSAGGGAGRFYCFATN